MVHLSLSLTPTGASTQARRVGLHVWCPVGADGTHVTEGCGLGAQLLALVVVAAAADFHSEAQVTDAAGSVGAHKDVAAVDVAVSHGRLQHA